MIRFFKFVLFALCFSFSMAQASSVAVSSQDAREWANSKGQELIQALAESNLAKKYTKLDTMLNDDVNLNYISKFVIGKYAKQITPEQMEQYTNLLHRYALTLYKQFNLNFDASSVAFSIDSVVEHQNFATVNCSVDPSKVFENMRGIKVEPQIIPVKFKLIRGTQNRIQAVDVEISGVSLVIEYRKRFYEMIKENGDDINWFLQRFNDQVVANEKVAYQKLINQ